MNRNKLLMIILMITVSGTVYAECDVNQSVDKIRDCIVIENSGDDYNEVVEEPDTKSVKKDEARIPRVARKYLEQDKKTRNQ